MHFPITGLRTMVRQLLSVPISFQFYIFRKYSVVVPLESGVEIGVIGDVAEDVQLAGVSAGTLLHLDEAVVLEHFVSPPLQN